MKKKLLTLLTLLLCAVGGANAVTETTTATLNNWTGDTGSGGTLTWDGDVAVINCGGTDGNAVSLISDKSYKNISNINLTVYVSGRDKTALKVEIGTLSEGVFSATKTISSTYDSSAKKLTIGSLSVTKNSTNTSGNVAIDPATSGYIRISMANSGGKDKTGKFVGVKITAEPKNVTSATLTGIKINGTS